MRKGKGRNSGLLPSSLRIISSCLKTVSSNATTVASTVRSSVASSISSEDHKDQVTWAGFDRLELGPFISKRVLLLGYQNGFQVLDVEDASNFSELVSKRDGPVSFLQMQPLPEKSNGQEGFRSSHPLLLVLAGDDTNTLRMGQNHCHLGGVGRDVNVDSQWGNCVRSPTSVRFYSLRSHCYVHILRYRSPVHMVRCSPWIVAVGLATQIYCVDALTLENKFSVLTYPIPQLSGQGPVGVNKGYGPMAVGHRWLAYASNNPLVSNISRLSPQNLTPSPGVSPSTSPGGTSLVAHYAMESGKQLAAGIINLGDVGCKTFSRYYQELLPDGSNSPVSSTSGWKIGRSAGTDVECVGTVIVKDFVSRDVISQFKAHTSPISALCFDPSGTLLVTASVNGNNINVFRIMPSCTENAAGLRNYDWSSSHVHLYKLHRGMTSAMIQDICFSHYSQWIAIVSSKGTCHIFVLSPFGGNPGFQSCKNMSEEPSMHPLLTLPWWYTSDFVNNQHSSPPPPPVSLSVVSRIKYSSFGWLNTTAGNANGVAAGKVFVPSGAVAAIFHNSTFHSIQQLNTSVKALEHLLVYTPSGHVVQHELLPSIKAERDNGSRTHSTSFVHVQEDDLKVKVEPVQWWDVCRRSDWPEREECISQYSETQSALEVPDSDSSFEDNFIMDFVDMGEEFVEKKTLKPFNAKFHESSHLFLSKAEVQVSTARLPIWQKSKIFFYAMHSLHGNGFGDGEHEIESVPFREIEIKQKELLPVFDHLRSIRTCWNERGLSGGRCTIQSSVESHQNQGKVGQETVICHSNPASRSSTGSSECGSSKRFEHLFDLDHIHSEKPCNTISWTINDFYQERIEGIGGHIAGQLNKISLIDDVSSSSFEYANDVKAHHNHNSENELRLSPFSTPVVNTVAVESMSTNSKGINDISTSNAKSGDFHLKIILGPTALPTAEDQIDLGPSSSEAVCKALEIDEGHKPIAMTDAQVCGNDGNCEGENPVEDGEVDDFLGGMFAFSEDG